MKLSEMRTHEQVLGATFAIRNLALNGSARLPKKIRVERYLSLLGVEQASPSFDALAQLTRAHARTIPFENFTAILRRRAHLGQPVPPPIQRRCWRPGSVRAGGRCAST